MKRTGLHSLDPASARRKIAAAKTNKPFMAALLDRGHRGHEDAVEQWSRVHDATFAEPARLMATRRSASVAERPSPNPAALQSDASRGTVQEDTRVSVAKARGSSVRQGRSAVGAADDQPEARRSRQVDESPVQAREEETSAGGSVLPNPAQPRDIESSALSPLLRRDRESNEDWLGRLRAEQANASGDVDRLLIIREAILREIGFYDLGAGQVPEGWIMSRSDWETIAALQNIPADGWHGADQYSRAERETFERTGELPLFGVVGPDGNIYHRLTIKGLHPVGDRLRVINAFIRTAKPHPPDVDAALAAMAMMGAVGFSGRGVAPRLPMLASAVPAAVRHLRTQRNVVGSGLAAGAGAGLALRGSRNSEMEAAPDLPAAPGFEPERPEERMESFPEHRPVLEPSPGFQPEGRLEPLPGFPDQRGELPNTDIMDAQTLPDGTQPMPAKTRGGQDWEPLFNSWMANAGQKLLERREDRPTDHVAPPESFIWQNLTRHSRRGRDTKTNGLRGRHRRFFEWDYGSGRHESEIEVYDRHGAHIGAMDPLTGLMKEESRVDGREIKVEVEDDDGSAFV